MFHKCKCKKQTDTWTNLPRSACSWTLTTSNGLTMTASVMPAQKPASVNVYTTNKYPLTYELHYIHSRVRILVLVERVLSLWNSLHDQCVTASLLNSVKNNLMKISVWDTEFWWVGLWTLVLHDPRGWHSNLAWYGTYLLVLDLHGTP